MTVFLSEFLGTAVFLFFGVGTNFALGFRKKKDLFFLACGWAIAVLLGGLVAAPSGSHLNPAFTLALAMDGTIHEELIKEYISGQLLGSITGSLLAYLVYALQFHKDTIEETIHLFVTAPAISFWPLNLLSELITTCVMVFVVRISMMQGYIHGMERLMMMLVMMGLGMAFGSVTGFALNPVKDLGPRIAHFLLPLRHKSMSNWGYALVPVLGSILGALLAVWLVQVYHIW